MTWNRGKELSSASFNARSQLASDNLQAFLSSIQIILNEVEGLERDRTDYLLHVKSAITKLKTVMVQVQEDKKKSKKLVATFNDAMDELAYLDRH